MRRLTTPEHRFTLQMDPSVIDKIRITYAQSGKIVLNKENGDIQMDGNVAFVKLTQEETKLFVMGHPISMQIRVLTINGDALASDIIDDVVFDVLDDEVMA